MSADERTTLVRRFFEEFCNGRRLDLADELFAADHVYHDPQIPNVHGPRAMAEAVAVFQTAVDGTWRIDEILPADDNHVVARWTGIGTHVGELMGIAPTGRPIHVSAISVFRIADGKLAEQWCVWDTLGMLQQLGVVPPTGTTGSAAD